MLTPLSSVSVVADDFLWFDVKKIVYDVFALFCYLVRLCRWCIFILEKLEHRKRNLKINEAYLQSYRIEIPKVDIFSGSFPLQIYTYTYYTCIFSRVVSSYIFSFIACFFARGISLVNIDLLCHLKYLHCIPFCWSAQFLWEINHCWKFSTFSVPQL